MTSNIPSLAIVGHPNKGKSSIVSTLSRDDSVLISSQSGTTTHCRDYPMRVDGQTLYQLTDTPGFQRARSMLHWLTTHSESTSDRISTLNKFIDVHKNDSKYLSEVELLTPILDGSGILYVVDGSKPYGEEYEAEMEILRWTNQPSMALINLMGDDDHTKDWQAVLNQYFKIVRVFNPMTADGDRIKYLLEGFSALHEPWRQALETAVGVLEREQTRIQHEAAGSIAQLLCASIGLTLSDKSHKTDLSVADKKHREQALFERYQQRLIVMEHQQQSALLQLYRHRNLDFNSEHFSILEQDLLSKESYQLFGLDQNQLIATTVTGGAAAGGLIDLAVGGHSFFLGAGIGAAISGVTAWLASDALAKIQISTSSLGQHVVSYGPVEDRNFPYVLLSRALVFQRKVATQTHANHQTIEFEHSAEASLLGQLSLKQRMPLEKFFTKLRKGKFDSSQDLDALTDHILKLMQGSE